MPPSAGLPPAQAASAVQVLQGLILPEAGLCSDPGLYLRFEGDAGFSSEPAGVALGPGSALRSDCYFNIFNLGKWQDRCALQSLALRLQGTGRFDVTIWQARTEMARERLTCATLTLAPGRPALLDIPLHNARTPAVLYAEIRAFGAGGHVMAQDWVTSQSPLRQPQILIAITTFQNETAIGHTAKRFDAFIAQTPLAPCLDLVIIDNGRSADIPNTPKRRVIPSENLGGTGGFARGLLEARALGASHCLFMDDDAAIHMESLARTWAFLAYATDPATAVAGALSSGFDPTILWENGAVFTSRCSPRYNGFNLRHPLAVITMELETTAPPPPHYYGGWWFFAFPLAHARHMPFPFFVRGDDISFCLANPFNTITLPGVMSFQDVDFSERESLLTLYLDLRSHLAHHLALPSLDIGRWRTARIAAWFFARSLYPCHYQSLAALNLAIEDVLSGPGFFAKHADLAQRRQDIAALRGDETWRAAEPMQPDRIWLNPESRALRWLMRISLNGHFLPFFGLYGNRITLSAHRRGDLHKTWGAARITFVNARQESYSLRHNKWRGLWQSLRMTRNIARLLWRYPMLKAAWHKGYNDLTKGDFWHQRLGQTGTDYTPHAL